MKQIKLHTVHQNSFFEVGVEHQQRVSHLFGPMPPEIRDDTAFMDRIHAYLPGWDVPKINKELLTDHFGLVSDFLSLNAGVSFTIRAEYLCYRIVFSMVAHSAAATLTR